MKKIENKITSLVFTIDDVVKEVSLPNTKDNIAFEIVLAKYDQSTIADIISNDSANGDNTQRLTEYREWYAQAKEMVQTLNISSLNAAAKDKIEADRIEAERLAAEKAAKEAEEAAKQRAEAEEAARIEAEKREAERKEAERKAAEAAEAARIEAERIAAEKAAKEAEERAYYEEFVAPVERFNAAKSAKLAAIEAYDVSDAVNGFSINGINGWLDRDTRTSLTNTVSIEKAAGMAETTLWFGANSLTLNCDLVLGMLAQLEMYAHKCYNVTQQHKAEVSAMTTIEEIEAYDIETGYPEQLAF